MPQSVKALSFGIRKKRYKLVDTQFKEKLKFRILETNIFPTIPLLYLHSIFLVLLSKRKSPMKHTARPFILGIYQSNFQAHTWLLGI